MPNVWTPDHDRELRSRWKARETDAAIADAMGRSLRAVANRRYDLGLVARRVRKRSQGDGSLLQQATRQQREIECLEQQIDAWRSTAETIDALARAGMCSEIRETLREHHESIDRLRKRAEQL